MLNPCSATSDSIRLEIAMTRKNKPTEKLSQTDAHRPLPMHITKLIHAVMRGFKNIARKEKQC